MRLTVFVAIFFFSLSAAPLHQAIKQLDNKKIHQLLKECKNIDEQDNIGDTPLHVAVKMGRLNIVKEVLRCEPNAKIKNKRGNTPLSIAITKNRLQTVNLLLAYQKSQAKKTKQRSVIQDTIARDDIKAFKVLIKMGLDINNKDKDGVTLLDIAAKLKAKKIVKFLLQNGANVKIKDKEQRDALYYAIYGGDKEIIAMIRKRYR